MFQMLVPPPMFIESLQEEVCDSAIFYPAVLSPAILQCFWMKVNFCILVFLGKKTTELQQGQEVTQPTHDFVMSK